MRYLNERIMLNKWKETNDTKYVYFLFQRYRSRLENQIKKTISRDELNYDVKDFVNEMYEATLEACNAYRTKDHSDLFLMRLYRYNFFYIKRKLRLCLANNNAVLNSCYKNREHADNYFQSDCVAENKIENLSFKTMEEKFLSFLQTMNFCNEKVKKAILLKYHGYTEEYITKTTRIPKANLHSYMKYFQTNFRKRALKISEK